LLQGKRYHADPTFGAAVGKVGNPVSGNFLLPLQPIPLPFCGNIISLNGFQKAAKLGLVNFPTLVVLSASGNGHNRFVRRHYQPA